jgi:hypothetical protein
LANDLIISDVNLADARYTEARDKLGLSDSDVSYGERRRLSGPDGARLSKGAQQHAMNRANAVQIFRAVWVDRPWRSG